MRLQSRRRGLLTLQGCPLELSNMNDRARLLRLSGSVGLMLATMLISACGSMQTSPRQVQASNPTVTYRYRNDDELVKTNQLASSFCEKYHAIPRAVNFTTDSDRQNIVVYECATSSGS